jgi:TolB-like protein
MSIQSMPPAQLIEAATGAHLWANRFDGLLGRRFRASGQGRI